MMSRADFGVMGSVDTCWFNVWLYVYFRFQPVSRVMVEARRMEAVREIVRSGRSLNLSLSLSLSVAGRMCHAVLLRNFACNV